MWLFGRSDNLPPTLEIASVCIYTIGMEYRKLDAPPENLGISLNDRIFGRCVAPFEILRIELIRRRHSENSGEFDIRADYSYSRNRPRIFYIMKSNGVWAFRANFLLGAQGSGG